MAGWGLSWTSAHVQCIMQALIGLMVLQRGRPQLAAVLVAGHAGDQKGGPGASLHTLDLEVHELTRDAE